jgi:glycosyltransferase involved in cell wall biosynthesis
VDVAFVARDDDVPRTAHHRFVGDTIATHFASKEVLVEAPEVSGSAISLPRRYRLHVRLHCPTAFVQIHNGRPLDLAEFARELSVVQRACVVSSPSHALLRELTPYLDVSRVHVYKNPPPAGLAPVGREGKTHDVVFLARFRPVKGVDFLNGVLAGLPASYVVVVAGRGFEEFRLDPAVRCRVTLRGEVRGPERYRLLGGARVALTLSRFENCSMMVLECLALGTVVAGWDVGGHAEIAGPDLIRLVPLGDTGALVATVVEAVEGTATAPEAFRAATARLTTDFRRGWQRVWSTGQGGAEGVYRGLDCRGVRAGSTGRDAGHSPRVAPMAAV